MLNLILFVLRTIVVLFSIFGIMYLAVKRFQMHFDEKLLKKISDDVKSELRKFPSYFLMDEETKRQFKKPNTKEVWSMFVFALIFNSIYFLLDGDMPLSSLLWTNVPFVLIAFFLYAKYSLRVAKFREIYEIRAFCADSYRHQVSLVYYDYKKMQYCITTILSNGYEGSVYHSFCWAMAVERGESIKVIDISPREYEEVSKNIR